MCCCYCSDLLLSLGFSSTPACDEEEEEEAVLDGRPIARAAADLSLLRKHKVLVFTQYSRMLDVIHAQLLAPLFPSVGVARIDGTAV
jgi:hypothetical protein